MKQKRNPYLVNKAFNSFLLASILTVSASQLGSMVDGLMLSHFDGEQAMSSVNICRPVIQLLYALTVLVGAGSSMLVGVAIGNRDHVKANRIFSGVMILAFVMSVVLLVIGVTCLEPIVRSLCPEESLFGVTASYFFVTVIAAPFFMLSIMLEMFVTVDGSPKRVSLSIVAATLVNIFLDYMFIDLFDWGVAGAAYATMISNVVSVLFLIPHFMKKKSLKLVYHDIMPTLGKSVAEGIPFGLATMLIAVQLWGNNCVIMKYLGDIGIVALSVCMYLLEISMIILSGTLKTFLPVASILKGAGDRSGVMMTIRRAYGFMAVCFFFFVMPLIFAPQYVSLLFGVSSPRYLQAAVEAIPPFSANIILMCMLYLLLPIYQLYDNSKIATFLSVCQSLAPTFGIWLFAEFCIDHVWWGFAFGQLFTAVCIIIISTFGVWRDKSRCPLILVPKYDDYIGFETSIEPNFSSMAEALASARDFFGKNGVGRDMAMHIELTSEELINNIITHGMKVGGKKRYIDYRLVLIPEGVKLILCDDARPFNPIEHKEADKIGLTIVKGMYGELKYDYIFHQNTTTSVFQDKVDQTVPALS